LCRYRPAGVPTAEAAEASRAVRIICGGRAGGLRISLHTDNDDADRLVESLRRL
jgi:hypothetical protein